MSENSTDIRHLKAKYDEITKRKQAVRKSPLARKILLAGENLREFEGFKADLLTELQPFSKVENILAEKFIFSAWKLRRTMVVEKNLLNQQNAITEEERYEGGTFGAESIRKRVRNINRIDPTKEEIRYLSHLQIELQKIMNKTLGRLREEQNLRNQQPVVPARQNI